jgi:DNA primase
MLKISQITIKAVSDRADLVAIAGEYTRLEKRGGDYWGCCPFHHESTPSFHIIPLRKMYHCFGCGVGGDAITFYKEIEKLTFSESVVALAKKYGVEIIYDGNYTENTKDDTVDYGDRKSTRLNSSHCT